jgi:hypothetical protein
MENDLESRKNGGIGSFLAGAAVGFLVGFLLKDSDKKKLLELVKEFLEPLSEPKSVGVKKKTASPTAASSRRLFVSKLRRKLKG